MTTDKVFPPSKFIKDELENRKWTQIDLAFILGRNPNDISLLVSGKKRITPEVAQELASAFGTKVEYWLNLENQYRLSQLDSVDEAVARRSRLYNTFPAKEILKRGWVSPSNDVTELEAKFLRFFGISSLDDEPKMPHAARKSGSYAETTIPQIAWLKRAEKLARAVMVKQKFSDKSLAEAMDKLRLLLFNLEEIRHVPTILADAGIRLIIIEPLANTKIDGVTFWVDSNSPVIVLSLRFDRVDAFWQTILHEASHVKHREGQDAPIIDMDLIDSDSPSEKPEFEQRADRDAAEFSIPSSKLNSFISRVHPSYYDDKILGFSALNKIHPGILVGQLHHNFRVNGKGLTFSHQRKFLVKVRHILTQASLTDGWGFMPPISE